VVFGAAALLLAGPAAAQPAPPATSAPGAAPAPAPPPPATLSESLTGEPKADYDLGKLLFSRGDYGNALLKFRHAHELSGDPRLLWNVVACETKLHRYAQVLSALEGGQVLTADDLRAIGALEKASRELVCALRLTVSEAGAQVLIDDEPAGITPLAGPVLVDAGAHRIRVSKPGYKDQVRTEQVDGGSQREISLQLERDVHEGRLIVRADPGARIALDGKMVGVGRWEGTVASGGHSLRVTAEGMVPYQSEVLVQDRQVRTLPIELRPAENPRGLPAWLWIAGGVALAAGAVAVGVVVLSPDADPPTQGTVGLTYASFGGRR
jgi:hypothetical protein